MNVVDAISKRRSIRKYQNKPIPLGIIYEIINAGRLAPSGCNVQPTKYFIITRKMAKERLKEKKIFYQNFVYNAPVILVLCGNPAEYDNFEGARYQQEDGTLPEDINEIKEALKGQNENRLLRDISIASAFSVLRATELDLGTCYVGLFDKEKLAKQLNLPSTHHIPFVLTLGYPDENPQPRSRRSIEEIIIGVR